ncbi:Cyclic nucleotide-binding domain protein [Anatilimnocola aggregata]|uniref:Cyclic nucleotide-binding domain protein n=1 Tax=Anatilimnocola aggregata TaxID=2528021 RepID=A0A517Y7C8_9BACT|nr:Crp/Fnr family transcriptional regulator [Anatilimnocola aggregata]QDU26042.1 Cyclic nucleotide-binding domain protein [Anatilimnocola aggregata]
MSGNHLLARLPRADLERLESQLQSVKFEPGQVLYEARAPIVYSYFPVRGTLSAVVVMSDGRMIEVATVGNEGMVGSPNLFQSPSSPNRVFVQVPGYGLRIETKALEREARQSSTLQRLLVLYHSAYLFQMSQSVACNGLHSLLERCCRWLLMTHDRAEEDSFQLTHEFLATMLGVRRSSVTEALQSLQEKGLISGTRGKITIVNREGLEAGSCECYRAVTEEHNKLLNS